LTLYICALPVGCNADITYRVKEQLAQVPVIFCEDTRVTKQLLKQLNIFNSQQLFRMDQYQEKRSFIQFDRCIANGDVAYVSDAGVPGLADPGAFLVSHARSAGTHVVVLPGASALTTFISGCGVLISAFHFGGFLPKKSTDVQHAFDQIIDQQQVGIWFESPKRLLASLTNLKKQCPTIPIVVAKELTKRYETFISGSVCSVIEQLDHHQIKGEWLFLIDARAIKKNNTDRYREIAVICKSANLTGKQVKALAPLFDCKKNELYDYYQTL
tara:strand:- start:668 stop:1480 length:813 start_codon:yes stop_codon:yes gene_type:complete